MTSTGFFHSIKEKLFHGEKHVDADYETAFKRFDQLNTTALKLKANSNNYVASLYSVFLNSNNVSVDFSTLLEEANAPNPYQPLAAEFRAAHNKLNSERQQHIAAELTEKVLRPIEDQLKTYQNLQTRIAKRNELHNDLEYYLNKVHELNKERDERSSKGKSETSKNIEKFDRNQQKLSAIRNEYTAFTSSLIADLTNAWNARIEVLGPALACFVQTEKLFLQIYATELSTVNNSHALQSPPVEAIQPTVVAADIPRPVVAGDLQNKPVEGQSWSSAPPEPAPMPMASSVPGGTPPAEASPAAGTYVPGPALEPNSNPFEEPSAIEPKEGDFTPAARSGFVGQSDANTYVKNDSTFQTPTSQVHIPGGMDAPAYSSNPQASTAVVERDIIVDPTTVQQEISGYAHTTTMPGMAQPNAYDLKDPNAFSKENTGILKSQGEEESKRQRYEEEQKIRADALL